MLAHISLAFGNICHRLRRSRSTAAL